MCGVTLMQRLESTKGRKRMNQVSIIIPVHNTPEEYLRECLHSVLRQDYTNWEAILIDDGSTSGAERICDEYAAKDARFCVIHQRQSGVSAARNAGMAAANGDWLIFLDSDDWWEDNLLSSAMKKLAEEPADLLVFSYWNAQPQQNVLSSVHGCHPRHTNTTIAEELQLGILNRNNRYIDAYTGAPWMQVVNRKAIRNLRFDTQLKQCEDALFNMNLLENVKSVALLDEPLMYYRIFDNSAFHRFQENLPEQMELINQRFRQFLEVNHKSAEFWDAYDIWLMESYVRLLKRYFYHPNNPQSEAEKKRAWKKLLTTCPSLKQLRRASWKKMYQSRKSYPLLLFFLLYCRCYALNRRVTEWLLRTDRY